MPSIMHVDEPEEQQEKTEPVVDIDQVLPVQVETGEDEMSLVERVSGIFVWLTNITPLRVVRVYSLPAEENSGPYIREKYDEAARNPVSWFLGLDTVQREELLRLVREDSTGKELSGKIAFIDDEWRAR